MNGPRRCPLCDRPFRAGELVELTIIAPWHPIDSKRSFSIGQPVDAYPESLQHNNCYEPEELN